MKLRLTHELADLETLAAVWKVDPKHELDRSARHEALAEFCQQLLTDALEPVCRDYLKHRRAELQKQMDDLEAKISG